MKEAQTTIYVSREVERALGIMPSADYRIVTNRTPFGEAIKKRYPDFVTLIEGEANGELLDTSKLLEHPDTKKLIGSASNASILVFKNTTVIESIAEKNGWKLLNPSASLSEEVENKLTQITWLGDLAAKYLPEHVVAPAKDLKWNKQPRIVQWAHGHTGGGTTLVNSAAELKAIQDKFPERTARSTEFILGPSFTVSVVVAGDSVLLGNPSYQITGLPPFTDNPLATVGNDWSVAHDIVSASEHEAIESMASDVGKRLAASGWRGLFGLDMIYDDSRNRMYLIEINARQPASVPLESAFQEANRQQGLPGLTVFEAHLKALHDETLNEPLIPINDGAQIVQRVTKAFEHASPDAAEALEEAGFTVISYENTEPNADLMRVQSTKGIIERHGKLNKRGEQIQELLEK